jgi:hypothetical protein
MKRQFHFEAVRIAFATRGLLLKPWGCNGLFEQGKKYSQYNSEGNGPS